jgi:hypothetical protein
MAKFPTVNICANSIKSPYGSDILKTTLKRYHTRTHDISEIANETNSERFLRVRQKRRLKRKIKTRLEIRNPSGLSVRIYTTKSARLPKSIKKSASLEKNLQSLFITGCFVRTRTITFFVTIITARIISIPIMIFGKNKCDVEYCTSSLKNESIHHPAVYKLHPLNAPPGAPAVSVRNYFVKLSKLGAFAIKSTRESRFA